MSTAEQIAVMQASLEGKSIEFTCPPDGTDWLPLEPGLTPSWNWESYRYRVAEERPREEAPWSASIWLKESRRPILASSVNDAQRPNLIETGWRLTTLVELPEGWEVRRKEEPEWRYFYSTGAEEQPWRLHRDGRWEKKNTWNDEWVVDVRLVETDAAGRPLP